MSASPNHTPNFDSVIVLPGCSFRWFDWSHCRTGARVQKMRVAAAVNLQQVLRTQGYRPLIKFTGTRKEALFAQNQINELARAQGVAVDVVYDKDSQRSIHHGANLESMLKDMPEAWNCWVVTNPSHWWRLAHTLHDTLGKRGARVIPHLVALSPYEAAGMMYGELSRGLWRNVGHGKPISWMQYLRGMLTPKPEPLPAVPTARATAGGRLAVAQAA